MKRYCQTIELRNDPELIEKYCEVHKHVWPEIIKGQREVGILSMEIYICGRRLFMVMDTTDDFDFERDMTRLSLMPRQAEWEAYVATFQGVDPSASSKEKWIRLTRIFSQD